MKEVCRQGSADYSTQARRQDQKPNKQEYEFCAAHNQFVSNQEAKTPAPFEGTLGSARTVRLAKQEREWRSAPGTQSFAPANDPVGQLMDCP